MDEATVLTRLARQYSPSGQERGAVGEFVRLARELGYRARRDRTGNGVAERGVGRPLVLFLGHIDTVPGNRPVVRRQGKIHGRGVVDAKGALAAALLGGAEFAGPGTFRIVAAVREETDSLGARGLVRSPPPDALIAGEPSGWDGVTVGYKGDLRFVATFRARREHWSSPHPTSGDAAVAWAQQLPTLAARHAGPSPFRSLSAKVVGLESSPTDDPETSRVTVDVRLPPGVASADVLATLRRLEPSASIRPVARIEATETARTDPAAVALCAAIREEGGRPTLWRRAGTSDLNIVARAWGIGGVAYGPGDSRLDHTSRESLSVAELGRAARVLRRTLARLAAGSTPRPSGAAP